MKKLHLHLYIKLHNQARHNDKAIYSFIETSETEKVDNFLVYFMQILL